VRTMYRLLQGCAAVRERRNQLRHPEYAKPELLAVTPNQVWSWDITKLKGPVRGTCFHLYVILDIFSRYVVGWMVAEHESALTASTRCFKFIDTFRSRKAINEHPQGIRGLRSTACITLGAQFVSLDRRTRRCKADPTDRTLC
jgi:transposase InsO family protein